MKAALFDLDGVVFNTEPQYTTFWGAQMREFHPTEEGLEKAIKGQTLTQIFERYYSGPLESVRGLVTERLDAFERLMTFDYVEGFERLIADLRLHGVGVALVTSSNLDKMAIVYAKRPEFKALFDEVLTSEDFAESKPSPDCYLKAAARFGVSPAECIVFEDSFNGLKAGRSAGCRVVALATTNDPVALEPLADAVVSDFLTLDYYRLSYL